MLNVQSSKTSLIKTNRPKPHLSKLLNSQLGLETFLVLSLSPFFPFSNSKLWELGIWL